MTERFVEPFRARWADMDFNQHMRNGAYLGCAEETRMRFLSENGWSMPRFVEHGIGPVVLEDRLTYKHELRLLEPFHVDLAVAAMTADGRRLKIRNRFVRDNGDLVVATVESVVVWLDLKARRPVVPPIELASLWRGAPRTSDFEAWAEKPSD